MYFHCLFLNLDATLLTTHSLSQQDYNQTMKLKDIIGQLFILGFNGLSISSSHPIAADIKERNLGGVILFDKLLAKKENKNNIESPAQVKKLTTSLQSHTSTPLLIAIDQEGGMVKRLKPQAGFPETASAWKMGSG